MALIMVKPEVAPVVEPQKVLVQPLISDVELLTSEFIELQKLFVERDVKSLVGRMDTIKKQLQAIANSTMDDKQPAIFTAPNGEIEFSERGKKTEVPDPLKLVMDLLDKFGPDVTASVVDIAITPLRQILSEFELKDYLIEQPGSRTLRAVRVTKGG